MIASGSKTQDSPSYMPRSQAINSLLHILHQPTNLPINDDRWTLVDAEAEEVSLTATPQPPPQPSPLPLTPTSRLASVSTLTLSLSDREREDIGLRMFVVGGITWRVVSRLTAACGVSDTIATQQTLVARLCCSN